MAPELIKGDKYDPVATDIWSLGIAFFAMVNGFMPFDAESDPELFDEIAKGKYEVDEFADLSDDCLHLISRMLDMNPKTRITIPEIREHVLMRGPKKEIEICIEEL